MNKPEYFESLRKMGNEILVSEFSKDEPVDEKDEFFEKEQVDKGKKVDYEKEFNEFKSKFLSEKDDKPTLFKGEPSNANDDKLKKKKELSFCPTPLELLNQFEPISYIGSDYVFYEDFSLLDEIFPIHRGNHVFDPGITINDDHFKITKDKSSLEISSSNSLLSNTLDVFIPTHPPFHVFNRIFYTNPHVTFLVWGNHRPTEFLHPHFYPP